MSNTMEPLKILVESLIKAPRRVDDFMFKWLQNVFVENRRRSRRPGVQDEHAKLLNGLHVMFDRLIGRDLAPVMNNTHLFLGGDHSPFFITWSDMATPNEKLVFEHICLTAGKGVVKLPPIKIDFSHAMMRLLLLILVVTSDDGQLKENFLRVHDIMLLALQRAEMGASGEKTRFAAIGAFLRHVAMHPLPRWDPYASIIPMI